MKKETRGRKAMNSEERKSERVSLRLTKSDREMLISRYGSMQVFFDHCLQDERIEPVKIVVDL